MFPHSCGVELAEAVRRGANPRTIVPDEYVVVRGGTKPIPGLGQVFSATVGPTIEAAASAVPYNKTRVTTAAEIRSHGGIVEWMPEKSPHGTLNNQHVHVTEQDLSSFSEPQPNPVPRKQRIDEGK